MKQETVFSALLKGLIIAIAVYAIIFIPSLQNSLKEEQEEVARLETELQKSVLLIDEQTESKIETVDLEENVKALKQELLEKNDIISKQTATMEIMANQLGGDE